MFFVKSEKRKRKENYRKSFENKFIVEDYYSSDYNEKSDIDFYTVSWNTPKLVELQIKLFKKFCHGNFKQIICDNSTDKSAVNEIQNICKKYDVTYIRVLDKNIPYGFSNSHELALNWIWKNVVKSRKQDFAFLDHDLFPVKDINVKECLGNSPVWGWYYGNAKIWYSWAGFAFFNWNYVKNLPLNFHRYKLFGFISLKGKYWVDTGSANWRCLYSKLDKEKVKQCEVHFEDFKTGKVISSLNDSNSYCQYFDHKNWLHIFDGANRQEEQNTQNRVEELYAILEDKLKE